MLFCCVCILWVLNPGLWAWTSLQKAWVSVELSVSQWTTRSPIYQNIFLMSINQCAVAEVRAKEMEMAYSQPVKRANCCPLFSWRSISSILIFTMQTSHAAPSPAQQTPSLFPLFFWHTLWRERRTVTKAHGLVDHGFSHILPSFSPACHKAAVWRAFERCFVLSRDERRSNFSTLTSSVIFQTLLNSNFISCHSGGQLESCLCWN